MTDRLPANPTAPGHVPGHLTPPLMETLGVHEPKDRGWFTRLVGFYLRRYEMRRDRVGPRAVDAEQTSDVARSSILNASIKSAASGAAAGTISTAATLFTAETDGIGGLVAIPIAGLTIGGEMLYRSFVHLELTVHLAEIFGVHFDPRDPDDLWRLYALVFGTHDESSDSGDAGRALVGEVIEVEGSEVGEKI